MENILEIKNLKVSYDSEEEAVLKGLDLNIKEGEFVTVLGPSGCGKTTLLKSIAGLLDVAEGHILLKGKDITNERPEKRNINTIFQNYALFPLMTVEQNIGYGLKIKKKPKEVIGAKVAEMLSLVDLEGYEKKMPKELSGGQQQRVAIARALIMEPQILLLDEPLGALDAELRRKMQIELRELQKKLNITFIFITHDRDEAIAMSDKIVMMENGKIQKYGEPSEVFDPKTLDMHGSLSRIDFVMENGERAVFCKKGIENCIEMLVKLKGNIKD